MEIAVYVMAAGLTLFMVALALCQSRLVDSRSQLMQVRADHDADMAELKAELDEERDELDLAREKLNTWISERTEAVVRLAETEKSRESLRAERDAALADRQAAVDVRIEAEKLAAVRGQELEDIAKRLTDWETAKTESLQAAKAAALSTASELSSKLIADHKREAEAAKKEVREQVARTTEGLLKQVDEITKTVLRLNDQVGINQETMDTVWRALSTPAGAGQFAEIGLENSLKSFGLEKGRDFFVQPTVEGRRLRPDAIVLLPGDTVLVVDSKASKFVLELAEAEGTEQEEAAYANLKRSMNRHLRGLSDKNYKAEIVAGYRDAGRGGEIRRIMSIMFLPNEGALEKLARSDPGFIRKAAKLGIAVAGPTALNCLIGFARVEIDLERQAENQERIVAGTQALLDKISVILEHTGKVGKGLKSATDHYLKLTGSVNGRLLPSVRELVALGVRPTRNGSLPKQIPAYQMVPLETGDLIEGDAETLPEPAALIDDRPIAS